MQRARLIWLIWVVAICSHTSSCEVWDDGTLRYADGSIIRGDQDEIAANQDRLLNAKYPEGLPKGAEGGSVFDGTVLHTETSRSGLQSATFNVETVLFGSLGRRKEVTIYSPAIASTGIQFNVGHKYRVFAVWLDGEYRTWDWTGTVELAAPNPKH